MALMSISVVLNILLLIHQYNAGQVFDLLTADNINISHVGYNFVKSDSLQRSPENKDFCVKIKDIELTKTTKLPEISISADGEYHRELQGQDDLYKFGVSEPTVRSAAALEFLDWPASPIYFQPQTPWGNLYQKFGHTPAHFNLVFDHINLLNFTQTDISVDMRACENRSNKKITCHSTMSYELSNTVSNTWSKSHGITIGASVGFDISIANAEVNFEYQQQWGESGTKSQTVTTTSTGGGDVELNPGEAILFTLMSRRGVWKAEVVYKAYLSDDILINYPAKHMGHYFFFLELPYALKFNNMDECNKIGIPQDEMERRKNNYKEIIEVKQLIEIQYFTNSSVIASNIKMLH